VHKHHDREDTAFVVCCLFSDLVARGLRVLLLEQTYR